MKPYEEKIYLYKNYLNPPPQKNKKNDIWIIY